VYPRKSNLFPRHKNNIVENIWCTAVICKNEKKFCQSSGSM
jgi:hypothetical protein